MSTWKRSSKCAGGDCVLVARGDSDTVYVRDSKLGDDSPVQEWPVGDWLLLVDAIVLKLDRKLDRFSGYLTRADGSVRLGWARLGHPVQVYTAEEWKAFEYGVRAGEFEPEMLSEKFKSSSFDPRETVEEERAGAVTRDAAPAQTAAAGAERSSSPPAPVAARSFDAMLADPHEQFDPRGELLKSVVEYANAQPLAASVPVAAPLNVPAGSTPTPRVDQPGLTNLERVHKVVLTQIRLGGSGTEIAEGIVADLQEGGLIVDDPVSDPDELLRQAAAPLVPVVETQETGS